MSLTGKWVNSYNSFMALAQAPDGTVTGEYLSPTNLAHKYYVLGYAGRSDPTPELGQPTALSIYWRPFANDRHDSGGHWVSGLAGQLFLTATGHFSLSLLHAIVAIDAIPDLAAPATYVEKLTYLPSAEGITSASLPGLFLAGSQGVGEGFEYGGSHVNGFAKRCPVKQADLTSEALWGVWVCQENGAQLILQPNPRFPGSLLGELVTSPGIRNPVSGFTDIYAWPDGLSLQAVSIAVLEAVNGCCMSLFGYLDPVGHFVGSLRLTGITARATAPKAAHGQDTLESWNFFWTRPYPIASQLFKS